MSGTIVCGVADSESGLAAAELAAALAARLELRLVLAHVVADDEEQADAERLLTALAHALGGAETRLAVGSRVDGLARLAGEEGADAIVIGSRRRGARGGQLRCGLGHDLEAATAVPVVIAPPATRSRSRRRLALA